MSVANLSTRLDTTTTTTSDEFFVRGARNISFSISKRTFHLASTVSPAGLATARGMDDAARSGAVDASIFLV